MNHQRSLIMPSSTNRFPVISTDNKTEDKCFVVTIIAILLLAAGLLFWSTSETEKKVEILPKAVTPVINQLSSTADEISFLIAAELLSNKPTLLQLQQQAISPFDSRDFSSPTAGCFLTAVTTDVATRGVKSAQPQYQIALWLDDHGHRLAWRAQPAEHGHHDDKHAEVATKNDAEQQCRQTNQGWQFVKDNHIEHSS